MTTDQTKTKRKAKVKRNNIFWKNQKVMNNIKNSIIFSNFNVQSKKRNRKLWENVKSFQKNSLKLYICLTIFIMLLVEFQMNATQRSAALLTLTFSL